MDKKIPNCIGMIMDGNRRWAKERNLPTLEGHKKGLENFGETAKWVREKGIKHLAVYALSTENWNRSEKEVSYLLELFKTAVHDAFERMREEGARVHFVGDLSRFPKELQESFKELEERSKEHDDFHVWVCLSYGGRLEIEAAIKDLVESGEEVTQDSIRSHMWSAGMPDPDLIIRTGGEKRLSNFLLWQGAYSELVFSDTYWPAFTKEELQAILEEYSNRERRYGK